jgi:hypothetical protein
MKTLFRQPHQSRSGYVALVAFLMAYTATMAVVIAPGQVKLTLDASWTWLFG